MNEKREKGVEAMTTEIERKFLVMGLDVADIPGIKEAKATKIDQGYLAVTDKEAVRIRRKGSNYFMTYKGAPAGHAAERVELECAITKEQFDTFWPGTEGRRVEKTRYEIPHGDHTIELDVFEDHQLRRGRSLTSRRGCRRSREL